ncbi:MAG: flagellar hook-basal body complex protein, partial [bacterium]
MIRALYSAASGMKANQFLTDTIAHNVANANTVGFKKDRADFHDLFYQTFREAGGANLTGGQVPSGLRVGLGSQPASTQKIFTSGSLQQTENPLDMAVTGDGFFRVQLPDGNIAYTRDGSFSIDASGQIVTSDGNLLDPPIQIPTDATQIDIGVDGTVSVLQPGSTSLVQVGS